MGEWKALQRGDIYMLEKYFTSWTKHANSPLQAKTCQNWFIAVYSNYNSEDKIYIFEQRNAHPSNNIEAWSFTRANAAIPANWTDHGVVYTATGAHDDGHIEPHGIIFETQAMADAREGGSGTRKWRLYYCAKGSGEAVSKYSANFAYASESDLTSWTAYSGNPVYNHDAEWGFADTKACIYKNKVWLHHCKYKAGVSCNPVFFSYSDNGLGSWTNCSKNWYSTPKTVGCTLVPFSTGILLNSHGGTPDTMKGHFTTDGEDEGAYSGNPVLSEVVSWRSIVVDKTGSANLNNAGTYYLYYMEGAANNLSLATSTTFTEEEDSVGNKGIAELLRESGTGWKALEWEAACDFEELFEVNLDAWTVNGVAVLSTEQYHQGAKSVKITGNNFNNIRHVENFAGTTEWTFYFKGTNTASRQCTIYSKHGAAYGFYMKYESQHIYIYDGAWQDLGSYPYTSWIKVKGVINDSTNKIRYYLNDVDKGEFNSLSGDFGTSDYTGFDGATAGVSFYIDEVCMKTM